MRSRAPSRQLARSRSIEARLTEPETYGPSPGGGDVGVDERGAFAREDAERLDRRAELVVRVRLQRVGRAPRELISAYARSISRSSQPRVSPGSVSSGTSLADASGLEQRVEIQLAEIAGTRAHDSSAGCGSRRARR